MKCISAVHGKYSRFGDDELVKQHQAANNGVAEKLNVAIKGLL